jgi:hypothetical protein
MRSRSVWRACSSHQQKQKQKQRRQRAGIGNHDSEEEGMREDWSVYCALADLGMEERVKGTWCVCVLRALRYRIRSYVRVILALKVARCGA